MLAYKGILLSNLFSADAKPKNTEEIQTTNCIYHSRCLCQSHYVGMTARIIKTRATEPATHLPPRVFITTFTVALTTLVDLINLKSKILNLLMASEQNKNGETNFSDLNDQKDHRYFSLFWSGQIFNEKHIRPQFTYIFAAKSN